MACELRAEVFAAAIRVQDLDVGVMLGAQHSLIRNIGVECLTLAAQQVDLRNRVASSVNEVKYSRPPGVFTGAGPPQIGVNLAAELRGALRDALPRNRLALALPPTRNDWQTTYAAVIMHEPLVVAKVSSYIHSGKLPKPAGQFPQCQILAASAYTYCLLTG